LGRAGKPDNGLIPVWAGANTQGAFDLGYRAEATADALSQSVVFIAAADPVGNDPQAKALLQKAGFRVVTSLFATTTTEMADVVLPRQSVPERDGTFTSGERRVQRFYTAQGFIGDTRPDWKMFSEIRHKLNPAVKVKLSAGAVMAEITKSVGRYAEMSYKNLVRTERQFPDVGGEDLYYGGTAYNNTGGIGVQWSADAEDAAKKIIVRPVEATKAERDSLLAVPVRVLYDRTPEFLASEMMYQRIPQPYAELNPSDAGRLKVNNGDTITLVFGKQKVQVTAYVNGSAPEGVILVPLYLASDPVPLAPVAVKVEK
jgi:NADH-quinone oxidoreductase subunit G